MANRETAITAARALAQTIWEQTYTQDHYMTAYYVERDGAITTDKYIGPHERESVYFGHDGCAARVFNVGRNGVGYSGSERDYRDIDCDIRVSAADVGRPGKYIEDHITAYDLPDVLSDTYADGLYWGGEAWHPLCDDVCHWTSCDVDDPSDAMVAAIEALPPGWFGDEATSAEAD